MKKVEISAKSIIEEKRVWENMVPKSTEVLKCIINSEIEIFYINLLFSFRVAKVDFVKIEKIVNGVKNGEYFSSNNIDKFDLQMKIRHYFLSICNVLDYLEKLMVKGKILGCDLQRKFTEIKSKVDEQKNQVAHDRFPVLFLDDYEYTNTGFEVDAFEIYNSKRYTKIEIQFENNDKKDLIEYIDNIYHNIRELIMTVSDDIMNQLNVANISVHKK